MSRHEDGNGFDRYAYTESEMADLVDKLPGSGVQDKILGVITLMAYTMTKVGVRADVAVESYKTVHHHIEQLATPFTDLQVDYNDVLSSCQIGSVKVDSEHPISPASARPDSYTPLTKNGTITEEDFLS